jgi:hypothetical protein
LFPLPIPTFSPTWGSLSSVSIRRKGRHAWCFSFRQPDRFVLTAPGGCSRRYWRRIRHFRWRFMPYGSRCFPEIAPLPSLAFNGRCRIIGSFTSGTDPKLLVVGLRRTLLRTTRARSFGMLIISTVLTASGVIFPSRSPAGEERSWTSDRNC